MATSIIYTSHPEVDRTSYELWRLTYEGGTKFIAKYLRKHAKEIEEVWNDRKALSYNPAFAKEAIEEFVRAITQRSEDVRRLGGSETYRQACEGFLGGVDRQNSTMNAFMATEVVPELLAMGRVGIYIDNVRNDGPTLADVKGHPYLYVYHAEDILNWSVDEKQHNRLTAILLREYKQLKSEEFDLPIGMETTYRYLYINDLGKVGVKFLNQAGDLVDEVMLDLTEIPFVMGTLKYSLLKDVANYQIALLNLASSDFFYAWASNFPVYTEQFNPMSLERFAELRENDNPPNTHVAAPEDPADDSPVKRPDESEIRVGVMTGRRYPMGAERPGFIHPSPEPMIAAMQKEEQLRKEIRELVQLAITNLEPTRTSAESKAKDQESGLEAGLSQIGRVLQTIENTISRVWHAYEGYNGEPTNTQYPEKYSLKTDEDRRRDSEALQKLQNAVASPTFQREISVEIVRSMFDGKRTAEEVKKMEKEAKDSPVPTADPEILRSDHEAGFVSDATASEGRGYRPGEAVQAAKDHALRLARIKEAQTPTNPSKDTQNAGARGLQDEDATPDSSAKQEKTDSQNGDMNKGGRGPTPAFEKQ